LSILNGNTGAIALASSRRLICAGNGEIVFKLSQRARTDDRKRSLGRDPGDGDFGGPNEWRFLPSFSHQ
jgi:hypothetical protein